ncbi:hypothetical protein ON010_g12443 [Phytophthora cinnamomi]|nr:hypothetical protein ON010_g12443 [Phytophthora cinnamomi]
MLTTSSVAQISEQRGRPRSYEDEYVAIVIRAFVIESNKERLPVTRMVADEVLNRISTQISRRPKDWMLRCLGYRYIKGDACHLMADSVQNVAYRAKYLQEKVANSDRTNNPLRPEVYLDESYVNVNHVRGATRLGADRKRYAASGKGTRKGSEGDYHGNFNAAQFELWFTDLCQQSSILHGPCNIYMDGATYHKRNLLPAPTTRLKRDDILEWLQTNYVQHDAKLFKPQLMEFVRAHKPPL